MGSAERRARHKEELREKILEAARAIIMRDGFSALTMRKIAAEIEYSPAAIYLHFRDRDEIANQLSREGYAKLYAALQPAGLIANPLERLGAIGKAYVRFGMENPETYRLIFMEYNYLAAVFGKTDAVVEDAATRGSFELLVGTAAELLASGQFRIQATPVEVAETYWAAVHGIVSLKLACPMMPVTGAEQLEGILVEALIKGMAGAPETKARPRGKR